MKSLKFLALAACMASFAAPVSGADSYPSKTVKIIVPFAPGGTTDIVARIVADRLGKELGQSVIVENRSGAGGSIGAQAIARAEPDGYTLGIATISTHGVNPACNPKLGYNPVTDFAPITNLARTPNVMAVNPKFPANNYKEFITHIKQNPGRFSYASSGTCSVLHMMGEQFKVSTGTFITHIPYRGSGPALNDVLGGQPEIIFDNLPSSLSHLTAGKLRPLAVAWHKRVEALPNVPTFAELGLKAVNDPAWYGLVAPAKTPEPILKRIHAAATKVLALPEIRERLQQNGAEPAANSPTEFAAEIRRELDKMNDLVK